MSDTECRPWGDGIRVDLNGLRGAILSNRDEQSAQAGMAWSDIAKEAYRAYAASTGNKNFRGDPMPEFEDLPQPIKTAWEAASRHIGDLVTHGQGTNAPEWATAERWAGWSPI